MLYQSITTKNKETKNLNMQTLLEKWNYFASIIREREEKYVQSVVKEIPEYVYIIWGHGNVRELKVTGVRYSNKKCFGFNKRPTRVGVEEIKSFALTFYEFNPENIYYDYTEKYKTGGGCRGSFPIKDIKNYMTKEQAEQKAKQMMEEFEADELLIKNGTHTRCERCRKTVENSSVVHYKIISIATYGNAGRNGKFCSGTCAGHEQMAHEG